jgi:hypothetical protein
MMVDSGSLAAKSAKGHIASHVQSKSAAAQSPADLFKRFRQILTEQRKITFNPAGAANHDMISAAHPKRWEYFTGQRAKAPLHSVAHNRIADLFGNRNAKPHSRVSIGTITHKQNETAVRCTFGRIGGKKVLARADFG